MQEKNSLHGRGPTSHTGQVSAFGGGLALCQRCCAVSGSFAKLQACVGTCAVSVILITTGVASCHWDIYQACFYAPACADTLVVVLRKTGNRVLVVAVLPPSMSHLPGQEQVSARHMMLVHTGMYRYTRVHTGTHRYIQIYTGS